MADPHQVTIAIRTVGDPSGAQTVQAAVTAAAQATNPWTTAARSSAQANAQQAQAAQAAANAADNAANAARNAAQGAAAVGGGSSRAATSMLLFGQALEDAQYGLRGVMNNIPGLVMSLGLGAGAAGALQVTLVAVSQALDLLQLRAKEPVDWSALTPEEQAADQLRKFNAALKEQAELLERLAEARGIALEREKQWAEHRERMAKLEGVADDPQVMLRGFDDRTRNRQQEVSNLRDAQAGREANAIKAEQVAAAQSRRVQDLETRAKLELEASQAGEQLTAARQSRGQALAGSRGVLPPAAMAEYQAKVEAAEARVRGLREQLDALPKLQHTPGKTPEEDAANKKAALDQERATLAQRQSEAAAARAEADRGRLTLPKEEERLQQQQAEDERTTDTALRRRLGMDELQDPLPGQRSPLLDPAVRPLMSAPAPAGEVPPAAPPEPAADDSGKATANLDATRAAAAELNKTKESAVAMVADAFAKYAQTQAGELATVKDRLLAVEQSQASSRMGLS